MTTDQTTTKEQSSKKELNQDFVKNTYDTFLAEYPEEYAHYRWFRTPVSLYHYKQTRRVLEKVLDKKKYGSAFEVGGGDGVWTELFLPHVQSLDFLDISKEMVARAQKRLSAHDNIRFSVCDFLNNDFPDAAYESILSVRNFEYFPDKEKGVSEFARLLKSGGELILVTKSPEFDWSGDVRAKTLHTGQMSIQVLVTLLEKYGFDVQVVAPAIIGKKISAKPIAALFDFLHRIIVATPFPIIPRSISKYFSESFLVYAVKRSK